ncbi:MAG: hypothetical protein GF411_17495 [Candidatus Lokiarchaeota archaeon]|nr:hypothetical protein [Candidatus Lokiarchaeota archaeon]
MYALKPYFRFWSILLFLSILLASLTPFMIRFPQYDRVEYTDINENIFLSATNSTYNIELPEEVYQVDIRQLVTNGSKVDITSFNSSTTFFKMLNITEIDDIPISIESQFDRWNQWESWNITISRVDSDVSVFLDIRIGKLTQILVDYAPLQNFGVFGIVFAGIGLYWFVSSEREYRKRLGNDERFENTISPMKIASLIIIAGLLFAPSAISLYQSQTMTELNESVEKKSVNLSLNSTHPSLSVNLGDISNEDAIEAHAKITMSTGQNASFIVQLEDYESVVRYQIQYQELVSEQSWHLHIGNITRFSSVTVERLDQDVDVLIEVAIYLTVRTTKQNPMILAILAVFGSIPLVYAMMNSHRFDNEVT